jgi:AcrR family transcriptional regulator
MSGDGDLRRRLIDAAIGMLGEGAGSLSLRSVARAANVSAMAPYRHFADKAALLGAVAAEGFHELRAELEAADALASGGTALVEQGVAYVAFARRRPHLFRLMFTDKSIAAVPKAPGETAHAVLARRVAAVIPEASGPAALACWAMVHGLATLTLDERIDTDEQHVRAALGLLIRGMTGA